MFFGVLTLITALAISAVAIYYSVAGLVAIFAAAAVPIMIMGGVLEVAKLVTAVWLHWYWNQAAWWLKGYLSVAVIVLMFITSMGIFGFLSRAHIEQTASATESVLAIDRINSEIERQEALILRAEANISAAESRTNTVESEIQAQIDREQERIDSAYARIQPAINEQLAVIQRAEQDLESRLQTFVDQIAEIDQTLQNLQAALAAGDVRRAQGIVGERQDGSLGPATSAAIQAYRLDQTARRDQLIERIETIRNEPNIVVERAREEISRLRSIAEQQIADSDQLIARLRSQIGQTDQAETQTQIEQQLARIQSANLVIEQLLDERSSAEREYRILEAEVGPIKYIAEFVYGSTDKDLLEEAVRWVIIVIIFVFDPLAVLLLIASQFTFEYERKQRAARKEKENDNKQTTPRGPIESEPTEDRTETYQVEPAETRGRDEERDMAIPERGIEEQAATVLEEVTEEPQKKSLESSEESNNEAETEEEIARLESWNIKAETLKDAKHNWKELHPDETIKFYKTLYIKGKIEQLPWEEEKYVQNSEQNENSLFKKIQDARKDE
jgi:hypothetical protein